MENQNIEQLKKLAQIFNTNKIITPEDIKQVLIGIATILANYRTSTKKINQETIDNATTLLKKVSDYHEKHESKMNAMLEKKSDDISDSVDQQIKDISELLAHPEKLKGDKGDKGDSVTVESVLPALIQELNLPDYKEMVNDEPIVIAQKLESLEGDERLSANAIEETSLTDLFKKFLKDSFGGKALRFGGNTNGGGVQSITSKDGSVIINASGAKGKGVVDLSAPGGGSGGFEHYVVLSGSGTSWTLPSTPPGIVLLFPNGQLLNPTKFSVIGTAVTTTDDWGAAEMMAVY